MFLISLLFSAITLNPAMPSAGFGAFQGSVAADVISDKACAPGAICAKTSMKNPRNGCFFNNFWNNSTGGTPLTVNVTETGSNGSPVYIYWVNATNVSIAIKGNANANFYCPRK
jgi:hypothetical protein